MIKKLTCSIILILSIISCNTQSKIVNLIVYTDFVDPKITYDSLRKDFARYGLIDSIKIIGSPIIVPSVSFKIDTLSVNRFGIPLGMIQNKIDSFINISKNIDELRQQCVINESGLRVPISAFAALYVEPNYYEPEIFVPKPENYYHQGRKVVKIELYCKKTNEKEIIKFIKNNIDNYSDRYYSNYNQIEYEIVKDMFTNQ